MKQSLDDMKREREQYETVQGYMDALDAKLRWERADDGLAFSLFLTPKGNQYLVVRTIGSSRPWIEVYHPVDTSNRWDTMFAKMQAQEEASK